MINNFEDLSVDIYRLSLNSTIFNCLSIISSQSTKYQHHSLPRIWAELNCYIYIYIYISYSFVQSDGAVEYTNCTTTKCPGYDSKQSNGEVQMMLGLWRMQSTLSLPLLPGPLWLGMVAPDPARAGYDTRSIF